MIITENIWKDGFSANPPLRNICRSRCRVSTELQPRLLVHRGVGSLHKLEIIMSHGRPFSPLFNLIDFLELYYTSFFFFFNNFFSACLEPIPFSLGLTFGRIKSKFQRDFTQLCLAVTLENKANTKPKYLSQCNNSSISSF